MVVFGGNREAGLGRLGDLRRGTTLPCALLLALALGGPRDSGFDRRCRSRFTFLVQLVLLYALLQRARVQ